METSSGKATERKPEVLTRLDMGWLRLVGSLKLYVSFVKEPYERDIFCKRDLVF